MDTPGHEQLKAHHRQLRDTQPEGLRLREHRALSWLRRIEQAEDADGRFLFLWIAFNATYAQEISEDAHSPNIAYSGNSSSAYATSTTQAISTPSSGRNSPAASAPC